MNGNKVKIAIKLFGKTQAEMAILLGITREHLQRLLSSEVPDSYVEKLKSMGVQLDNVTKSDIATPIPYYDLDASAGNVDIFMENGPEYVKQYLSVPAFSDCEMFINVSGSSMLPAYCAGELIALKKINDYDVVPYNEAYLIVTEEQRLLKYIRKSALENNWLLCSENKDYEPFDVNIKKVLHLYIVKGKIAKNVI